MNEAFTAWTATFGTMTIAGFSVNTIFIFYGIMVIHSLFAAVFDRFFP